MTSIRKNNVKTLALQVGAVEAGIIKVSELPPDQMENVMKIMPNTKSILAVAVSYNQSAIKSQYQSISNREYRAAYKNRDEVCNKISKMLQEQNIESVVVTDTFPFDYSLETPWLVSHKYIAQKAGLGTMGINRVVMNERYGSALILGSILMDKEFGEYDTYSEYNPCIHCNLCISVCPTGSISKDNFDLMGCYTHNYRNRGNSFHDLLSQIEHGSKKRNNQTFEDRNELWTSIQEGYGFTCNRCIGICPASLKERTRYEADRKEYFNIYVKPFIEKEEKVYVTKGSRSELYVNEKNIKQALIVSNGMTIDSIKAFKGGLKFVFNSHLAQDIDRTYSFEFTGSEKESFLVKVCHGKLFVSDNAKEKSDIKIISDSTAWIGFLGNKKRLFSGLITGKIKVSGHLKYLIEFGNIFKI